MLHHIRWETVFQTPSEAEAHVIAGLLETRGIMARVHQEPAGMTAGQLGDVMVLVDARDYEQALAFLREDALEPR